MSAAPPAFADLFLEHLSPRLTRLCVALARCVAAGVQLSEAIFAAEDSGWSDWIEQNRIGTGARV
jgi:hypothetical protein